ncbi:hypothetical protein DFH06DRAFT_1366325 [Mycena polygramma]|nr:hypothetical protein DFH06DRAFT_1366325 [Mycena polygramma]
MARNILSMFLLAAAILSSANAYFLFGMKNVITTERLDPIVSPGKVSGHVHTIVGGSNFRATTNTSYLRQSQCTSSPIKEDKSNYWAPTLYFQWKNGSFTSVTGSPVIASCAPDYLFSDTAGVTTPFPDDVKALSPSTYDTSSYAQQAITFLCLDFSGTSTKHNELPTTSCPSGVRAQINFPSCWDGVNSDSADHKSHVAFLSGGPDSGTCADKNFPKTLPRIFMEMYLDTGSFEQYRSQAMNPSQPFVYAMGDPTGYGYHADFIFGWDKARTLIKQTLHKRCLRRPYVRCFPSSISSNNADVESISCCSNAGIFTLDHDGTCRITKGVDETATGTLPALPGNNPVIPLNGQAANLAAPVTPPLISPVYAYTGDSPTQTGKPVGQPVTAAGGGTTTTAAGATTTTSTTSAKATSTKSTKSTKKGGATSAPASAPSSGSGSASGSKAGSSGSGSSTPSKGSSSTGSGSGTGSTLANDGSSSSGSSTPASGGSSSSSSSTSSKSSGSGVGSSPASGSGNHTCHKKKRSNVHRARAFHESSRRRFASPEQRFVEHDL